MFVIAVDRCPMYFNDGADPWNVEENHIRVFNFDNLDTSGADSLFCQNCFSVIIVTLTALSSFYA